MYAMASGGTSIAGGACPGRRRRSLDEERRSLRPGHRRGDGRGPPVGEDEASAHGVRHLAQPRRRVRRVERDVGLARPAGSRGSPRRSRAPGPGRARPAPTRCPGARRARRRSGSTARRARRRSCGRRRRPRRGSPDAPQPSARTGPAATAPPTPAGRSRGRARDTGADRRSPAGSEAEGTVEGDPPHEGPSSERRGAIRTADLLGAIRALSRPGGARRRGEPTARPGPGGPTLGIDGRSSRGRRAASLVVKTQDGPRSQSRRADSNRGPLAAAY